ncbi:IS3 family transposase, partial [bacterium]|nr:IS3 family transposase [bacterium]
KRFSVEQIVAVLKQAEVGTPIPDLIRRIGITEQTFYRWKKQYKGLESEQVRELKQLQEENTRLKRVVADLTLDKVMLQDGARKKVLRPSRKRPMVTYLRQRYGVSERRSCRTLQLNRATQRYRGHRDPQIPLRQRLRELSQTRVRYGYRKMTVLLKREGWPVGKKLVYRLYREEGLTLHPRSLRRRKAVETRREAVKVTRPNEAWSLDFVADQLADGRRFRALTVLDVFTRECLAIEAGASLRGEHVVAALNDILKDRAAPKKLCCDNGSEFTSQILDLWAYQHQVKLDFSRPGKPTDNAYIESFNGTLRRECLNVQWFLSLPDAQQQLERWRHEYNVSRPHRALHDQTPLEFARNHAEKDTLEKIKSASKLALQLV